MKIHFSLYRVGLLLKADWIESRKILLYYSLIIIAAVVVYSRIFLTSTQTIVDANQIVFLFLLGSIITFVWTCQFFHRKLNEKDGRYLLLPATHFEKFLTCAMEFFLMSFVYVGLFYIGMVLWNCLFYRFIQDTVFYSSSYIYNGRWNMEFIKGEFIIYNFFSPAQDESTSEWLVAFLNLVIYLYVLGFISFKKKAGLITTLLMGTSFLVLSYTSMDFLEYFFSHTFQQNGIIYQNHYIGLNKITCHISFILNLLSIFIIYIIYLKFKEKEVR
ncbi:hypothetical protein [Parabacteroides pacaensis]|uniref:hypothetical protein n=1 Tax=Parabacteroides pacaensis TaxID=2086575 RepID=UPI000D0FCA7C|nr:hypothetical protein [Parabacteroides pacaensis]